jgi:glycopeptide antibiotics resistance protein
MGRNRWLGEAAEVLLPLLAVVAIAMLLVVALRAVFGPDDPRHRRWTRTIAVVTSIAVILVATLSTRDPIGIQLDLKLIPFEDLWSALAGDRGTRGAVAEIIANVILFVPFGLAMRWRFPSLGPWRIAAIAFAFSLMIETLQLVVATGRVANVTDVMMNTLGGLIGAWLVRPEPAADPSSG